MLLPLHIHISSSVFSHFNELVCFPFILSMSYSDTEAPHISCPSIISSSTDPGENTAIVTWSNVTAVDNSDTNPELGCTPESGGQFSLGVTEVVCEAIDSSGNKAECQFTVIVTGRPG